VVIAERRALTIPLDLDPSALGEAPLRTEFAALVEAALSRELEQGWRPVGAIDLDALLTAGRITQGRSKYSPTEQYYLLHTGSGRRPIGNLESVTIDLERERST
jgi:hypothetical protein